MTLEGNIAHSTRTQRLSVALLSGFAVLALALATVGIYGVISYSVTRRNHEIGIRIALGAARGRIVSLILRHALLPAVVGVLIGVVGGLALTGLLRSMLFGVSVTNPAVFAGTSCFLLAVSALAAWLPARRAARVDPLVALRDE